MNIIRNSKKVDFVDFVLENCEVIRVPVESFKEFKFTEIHKENEDILIEKLQCIIKDEGLRELLLGSYKSNDCIKRLWTNDDITHVRFITNYKNEAMYEEENLVVEWSENSDLNNNNQMSSINGDGDLVLRIKEIAQIEVNNIYIDKKQIVSQLKDIKQNILKRDNKSAADIGGLNIVSRLLMEISAGKYDKVVF